MESKWRLNRWLLGVGSDYPGILYARVLGPDFPVYVRSSPPGDFFYTVGMFSVQPFEVSDFPLIFQVLNTTLKPDGPFQPFPYGLPVESDHM